MSSLKELVTKLEFHKEKVKEIEEELKWKLNSNEIIGKNLLEKRKSLNLTLESLSTILLIHRDTISKIENGTKDKLQIRIKEKIINFLNDKSYFKKTSDNN